MHKQKVEKLKQKQKAELFQRNCKGKFARKFGNFWQEILAKIRKEKGFLNIGKWKHWWRFLQPLKNNDCRKMNVEVVFMSKGKGTFTRYDLSGRFYSRNVINLP